MMERNMFWLGCVSRRNHHCYDRRMLAGHDAPPTKTTNLQLCGEMDIHKFPEDLGEILERGVTELYIAILSCSK